MHCLSDNGAQFFNFRVYFNLNKSFHDFVRDAVFLVTS